MTRTLSHVEKERYDLKQQATHLQREADIIRRQLEMEREKYNELEQIQINDRKQLQQHQYKVHDLQIELEQQKQEVQRLILRSQSNDNLISISLQVCNHTLICSRSILSQAVDLTRLQLVWIAVPWLQRTNNLGEKTRSLDLQSLSLNLRYLNWRMKFSDTINLSTSENIFKLTQIMI